MNPSEVVNRIEAAIEHESNVHLHGQGDRIDIDFEDGTATLAGEVHDIAGKRLALSAVAALPEVRGIVDRLHVRPAERMGDGEIADHVEQAVTRESVFDSCAIMRRVDDKEEVIRPRDGQRRDWCIRIGVQDGVVTFDGDVPSLSHKRLLGAMTWWVPGTRDVVNDLGVVPDEADSDDEILDALLLVLEKDPLVDASQVNARCKDAVVTLEGLVRNDRERELAEFDAWAVFGVDRVENRIIAQPG